MKVVISIIALILFILLARFVYLRVTNVTPPVEESVLPVPSPSYFPLATTSPTPTATPTATPKASPKPTATSSGKLGTLPTTGANDVAYLLGAAGLGLAGLKIRKIRA